jgi:hypothetical protein
MDSNGQDAIGRITKTCQIIVGSLIAGVLIMLGIALAVDVGTTGSSPLITYIAVASGVALLPASFLVPGIVAAQQRRSIAAATWAAPGGGNRPIAGLGSDAYQTDTGKLAVVYLSHSIVGAAINEGAAYFAAIAYLIEKNPIALGLTFLLIGGLILRFPTRGRLEQWIDHQQELLIQDRQKDT